MAFPLAPAHAASQGLYPAYRLPVISALGLLAIAQHRVPAPTSFLLLVFGASHLVAMVMAAPWTYGYKSILPFQLSLLFAGAFLLGGRRSPEAPRVDESHRGGNVVSR